VILSAYIESKLQLPFKWGDNDCVTFVLGWVSHRVGIDYRTQFGSWVSEVDATEAIRLAGGIEFQCNRLFKPINPNLAIDGDIALIGRTVYLFSGANIVGPGESQLAFVDRMRAKCAWSYY
jgi:hypothetical protein